MMQRYRNSQLARRRNCGYAYERSYIAGDKGEPNPHLERGRRVHKAILEATRQILSGQPIINVHEIAYRSIRGGDIEYLDALMLLTSFQEQLGEEFTIDPKKVLFLEEKLELQLDLPDGGRCIYEGTPDLVYRVDSDTLGIDDYKTNYKPDSEDQFKADPQLKRYALLLQPRYPHFTRFQLTKRFIRYRGNSKTMVITAAELAQVRIDLVSEIMEEREIRERGVFKAEGGAWCTLCEHTHTCPAIRRYREQNADDLSIKDDDRARQLAGDVIAVEAWAARTKDKLKRYLAEHPAGAVPVSGGTFGFGTVTERELPPDELQEALRENSVEPPIWIFSANLKAVDRYKKQLPERAVAAIDRVTRKIETSRCQFRRHSDEHVSAEPVGVAEGSLFG